MIPVVLNKSITKIKRIGSGENEKNYYIKLNYCNVGDVVYARIGYE